MFNKLKNDGAWARANKALKRARTNGDESFLGNFKNILDESPVVGVYLAALQDIGEKSQVPLPASITEASLTQNWCSVGIPKEVWMGYFTFDTYVENTQAGSGKQSYIPEHAAQARKMGHTIRDAFRTAKLMDRMTSDIVNATGAKAGNPGGIADGTVDPKG